MQGSGVEVAASPQSPQHGRSSGTLQPPLTCRFCCALALLMHALPAAQVDILLNNAGLALGTAPVQGTTSGDALGMITTNCSAVVRAARGQHSALLTAHTLAA